MDTIKLRSPLLANGKKLTELKCDMDAIGSDDFIRAEALANERRGSQGSAANLAEVDYGFHLYLGFMGIIAADPSIDVSDLERLKGRDLVKVMNVGRFFALDADGDSTGDDSEAPSESTATSSASAPTK